MTSEEPPRDHVSDDPANAGDRDGHSDIEKNLKSRSTWLRLLFMIIIAFIYGLSRFVLGAVVILQFFWVLFTGETNVRLTGFGQSLATYTYQMVRYLTFNTESRPFPFDEDWPAATVANEEPPDA